MTPRQILRNLIPLAVVLALLLAWLPAVSAAPLPQPTVNISMVDNAFQPQNLTVQVGTTVVWTNNGNNPHTSTSDTGLWDSGLLSKGQTFSRTFDTPGTFPYHCTPHQSLGMVGTLTVVAAAQPTATPVPPAATPAPATATPVPATPTPTAAPAVAPTTAPAAPTATAAPPKTAQVAAPIVRIVQPAECEATNFDINLTLEVANFTISEGNVGQANRPGDGHFALFVDGQLRQQLGVMSANVTNLSPGPHTIRVDLVNNDNTLLSPPTSSNTVNFGVRGPGGAVTLPASCNPAAQPAPPVLPTSGDSSLPPWTLLLAGIAIVVGLVVRTAARR